jgi:hypothetical protein
MGQHTYRIFLIISFSLNVKGLTEKVFCLKSYNLYTRPNLFKHVRLISNGPHGPKLETLIDMGITFSYILGGTPYTSNINLSLHME